MIIKNKIWEELKQAKTNVLSIKEYVDEHRKHHRWYNVLIVLVASCGAFGYLLNEIIPLWATILITIFSVIKEIFPPFLQPEEELSELDSLMSFYNIQFVKYEHLYHQYTHKQINDEEAEQQIYYLTMEEADKLWKLNKLLHSFTEDQKNKIDKNTTNYFKKIYFNDYENNTKKEKS